MWSLFLSGKKIVQLRPDHQELLVQQVSAFWLWTHTSCSKLYICHNPPFFIGFLAKGTRCIEGQGWYLGVRVRFGVVLITDENVWHDYAVELAVKRVMIKGFSPDGRSYIFKFISSTYHFTLLNHPFIWPHLPHK